MMCQSIAILRMGDNEMKCRLEIFFATLVGFVICGLVILNFETLSSNLSPQNLRKYASAYVNEQVLRNYQKNLSSSGNFPSALDIENVYWQVLRTANGTFKMVNAYYDNREFLEDKPLIRILAYVDRIAPKVKTFCQLWFEEISDRPVIVKAYYILAWDEISKLNQPPDSNPYFVNCPNPVAAKELVPTSVSLVENKNDDASNNLRIINNVPAKSKKKLVAICTKDLEYPDKDLSSQLIEWIEIVSLLGVDKIFMYLVKVHPNMLKTLKYYENKGKLKIEMVTVPVGFPGKWGTRLQAFQQEMISLNDCFYKHINEYDFMLPIDTDEFIMPNRNEDKTYLDLINRLKNNSKDEKFCSYFAQNVFFLSNNNHENETQPEVPNNFYFLQQVHRAKTFSRAPKASKSFQSTENVIVVRNHLPALCVHGSKNKIIHLNDGKLHHYKRGCGACPPAESRDYLTNTVKDITLWKFKDELIANVKKALEEIPFD